MTGFTELGRGTRGALRAFGVVPAAGRAARLEQLAAALEDADDARFWLALSVRQGRLPVWSEVVAFRRSVVAEGLQAAWRRHRPRPQLRRQAMVVTGATVVDVHHTAASGLATGIQRVARALAEHLVSTGGVLIGWGTSGDRIVALPAERVLARTKTIRGRAVIPWNCTYLLPEIVTEVRRSARIGALVRASNAKSVAIGMDAIPLTTAETTGLGMPGAFSRHLAAVAHMDAILPISHASAREYEGWAAMLPAAGLPAPIVRPVVIAETAAVPSTDDLAAARATLARLGLEADLPLVLCVGSHEPRKNHDAVLVAAELLWREGHRFRLLFVGGNAWRSDTFVRRCARLRESGRPVASVRGISDGILWGLYREARFTVFPSLNEGFGLPIAESLLSGVPVVTSGFGSMAELAQAGGCLLVDPRSERSIADGMRRLLVDDAERDALAAEAAARRERTWDEYALQVAEALLT